MALTVKRQLPQFEKIAVRTILGANPANYASELLAQLFKQHSFLSEYDVAVQITRQEELSGYLYGLFVARPKAYEPSPDSPSVRIPIIAEARRVYPFDVFITKEGTFQPLTQTRLTSALFESGALKAVQKPASPIFGGDSNFTPSAPGTAGNTFDGTGNDSGMGQRLGQFKFSSIMADVLPQVSPELVDAFLTRIETTPALRNSMMDIPAFARAIEQVRSAEPAVKTASPTGYVPVSALLVKRANGFFLDSLSVDATGKVCLASRAEHAILRSDLDSIPVDLRQEAASNGFSLLGEAAEELDELTGDRQIHREKLALADTSGVYATLDSTNSPCRVAVLHGLHTIDGRATSRSLVVGEMGAHVQEKLAGIRDGDVDLSSIKGTVAAGRGVFIMGDTVTEPVNVRATVLEDDGHQLVVEDDIGKRWQLKLASVNRMAKYGPSSYLMPDSARFMPIMENKFGYATDTDSLRKLASAGEVLQAMSLESNSLGGVDFVDNRGSLVVRTTDPASASLHLMGIGDSVVGAKRKVAALCGGKRSKMRVIPTRGLSANGPKKLVKQASAQEVAGIYIDIVKEAAALADPDTVDSVLALSFVTPETCATYLEHLPSLEESVGKLAEMLLGSRIGVPDIPEAAVCSAMSGVDRAIQGLKKLQIRLSLPTDE